jgi:Ca2+-binding RTX toxin-like protein
MVLMPGRTTRGSLLSFVAVALATTLALAPVQPASAAKQHKPKFRCTISGTGAADHLRGTAGRDVICAGGGGDQVAALGGNDYVLAGAGDDRVDGGPGADELLGDVGDDHLTGGTGPDGLYGERGRDRLDGGAGADAVYGDPGADSLSGGPTDLISGGGGTDVGDAYDTADYPSCPALTNYCQFHFHLDVRSYIPNYTKAVGQPPGLGRAIPPSNQAWSSYLPVNVRLFIYNAFGWSGPNIASPSKPPTPKLTTLALFNGIPNAELTGLVPNEKSNSFFITRAGTLQQPNPSIAWITPVGTRVPPGQVGGPLYFRFVNGIIGADVYVDGFLFRAN